MKKITLVLSMMFLFASCASKNTQTLVVGTNAEYPPFEYLENGEIVGFDIELLNEISTLLGRQIKIENMSFDGLIPALQTKKIDLVISGMASTEDRKKIVNFSDVYYQTEDQRLIVKTDNTTISNVEGLKGKTAGAVLGFTSEIYLSEFPEIQLSRFNNAGEAILALKAGKIDAFMLDADPTKGFLAQNADLKDFAIAGTAEEYAMGLNKENTQLLEDLNKALSTLKENGKYQEIYNKYFPPVNN